MIGGDSKFVLTCTHARVPTHTHTYTFSNKRLTKWGSGSRKKKVNIFPSVDTLRGPCVPDPSASERPRVTGLLYKNSPPPQLKPGTILN